MRLMSVTRDTSHSAIGPCESLEHSPFGDNLRHESTALLSCTLDCGENAGVGTRERKVGRVTVQGQALCNTGFGLSA